MKESKVLGVEHAAGARWLRLATPSGVVGSRLVEELSRALRGPPAGYPTVITGTGQRFFSPGLDLNEVSTLARPEMQTFMRAFLRLCLDLFDYPTPTIASLNGHALAGGIILATCCDFRIAVSSARIGFTELNLDLALPYPCQRIIEQLLGSPATRRLVCQGHSYSAAEALEIGWLDALAEPGELASSTRALVTRLSRQSPRAFQVGKQGLKRRLTLELQQRLDRDLEVFLDEWYSEVVQRRLGEIRRRLNAT